MAFHWGYCIVTTVVYMCMVGGFVCHFMIFSYPRVLSVNLQELLPFLALGTIVGAIFTGIVFLLSAFTQPILMERRVDLATAVLTSVNAVWLNKAPMFDWGMIIFTAVVLGFLTGFIGFVFLMPLIGYATWHGYIDTIETKIERKYE